MFLVLNQRNIAEMGTSLPYADIGGYDWNGSAWTLQYEFKAYILVGILGIVGYAASRYLATIAAVAIIVFNSLLWSGHIATTTIDNPLSAPFGHPLLADPFNPMLIAPFAFGMLFAIWGKYIPVSDVAGRARCWWSRPHLRPRATGTSIGQYGLLYFLMWAAIRWTKLQHWEKYGDFSYGVYIFAWPLMQFGCYFGLEKAGMLAYFAVIVVATHAIAFCSWHLIEKPAMSLKDWSPAAAARLRRRPGLPARRRQPAAGPETAEPTTRCAGAGHGRRRRTTDDGPATRLERGPDDHRTRPATTTTIAQRPRLVSRLRLVPLAVLLPAGHRRGRRSGSPATRRSPRGIPASALPKDPAVKAAERAAKAKAEVHAGVQHRRHERALGGRARKRAEREGLQEATQEGAPGLRQRQGRLEVLHRRAESRTSPRQSAGSPRPPSSARPGRSGSPSPQKIVEKAGGALPRRGGPGQLGHLPAEAAHVGPASCAAPPRCGS